MIFHDEFIVNLNLKRETPKEVIDALGYLIYPNRLPKPKKIPDNIFFETKGYETIFFNEEKNPFYGTHHAVLTYDKDTKNYLLSSRSVVSTTLGSVVIERFLQWILPYINLTETTVIALTRNSLNPTSIWQYFIEDGKLMTRLLAPNSLDGTREVK